MMTMRRCLVGSYRETLSWVFQKPDVLAFPVQGKNTTAAYEHLSAVLQAKTGEFWKLKLLHLVSFLIANQTNQKSAKSTLCAVSRFLIFLD